MHGEGPGGQGTRVAVDSPVVAKKGTDVHPKEGSDLSTETLFEGGLMESKEGPPNKLQSEAEIIEGFITTLDTREKEAEERSPSTEGSKPNSDEGNCSDGNKRGTYYQVHSQEVLRLKRRGVTRGTVLDEEDPSSPIVDLDTEVPSQVMEESPKVEKKSLCNDKVS
ncbi:hypothetical protein HAX54_043958 [Datura stramonium]|uniref:Uncharacterized protein n=1 Tax=Datura stramonium TaxID=4076 RepID=A0ABS8SP91_DATST|nr:hypothetical protein [Datura stramonium]